MRRAGLVLLAALCCGTAVGAEPPARVAARAATDATAQPSVAAMLEEIRQRVQRAAVYPQRARRLGIEGVTRIQFQIDERGQATRISTIESSGSALLDAAAEQGARDAGPLPSLDVRIRIPIRFGLEAPTRPGLRGH